MASIVELAVWYTTRLPWGDLRGRQLTDSGDRPYTLAKLFMLMATRELARRLEGTGVDVFAGGQACPRGRAVLAPLEGLWAFLQPAVMPHSCSAKMNCSAVHCWTRQSS